MAGIAPVNPKVQFKDSAGVPLVGGTLDVYLAGTTTRTNTWQDKTQLTLNTNPIVLDSRGECSIWTDGDLTYKYVLKNAAGVTQWTVDNISGASGASSLVTFIQSGTGAVSRNLQNRGRDWVSVKDFGAVGDGSTDDTTFIQAAIDASVAAGQVVYFPAGTYKVTDTINIPSYTQLRGEHRNMNPKSFGVSPGGTKISFEPASAKSLFVASGTPPFGSFRSSYNIEGFFIEGNSTTSTGNSIYALDIDSIVRSRFSDIAIQKFRTGIRCDATINNRFEFIFIGSCYVQCVLYDGGTATTDVWDQCYITTAPIGVQTSGTNLAIRWINCIIESCESYGVNLVREVFGWEFIGCYSEDVPTVNTSTNAMFRVGFDGTTLAGSPQLTVIGGEYGGRNAGLVGAFIDVDYTDGVKAHGFHATRFTNVIRTSANTQTNQVALGIYSSSSITTPITDDTKISGIYGSGTYDSANRLEQRGKLGLLYCGTHRVNSSNTGTWGLTATTAAFNVTNFYPSSTDNTTPNGLSNQRWSVIYAGTGTIDTSDEREKQQIRPIDAAALRAWAKVEYCQYKFNDAVEKKGDGARWHFGVIAQRVKEAFESEGLDPFAYGVLCYDEWDARDAVLDADGSVKEPAWQAGNRYGIRYEEALALECAYLRSRLA